MGGAENMNIIKIIAETISWTMIIGAVIIIIYKLIKKAWEKYF
jgi:hypothetical protein